MTGLDAVFDDLAPDAPGCAVVLMRGGEPIWTRCLGLARLEDAKPITPSTRFRIASVSKPMVALVAAALADVGILDLADSIVRWVPELRVPHPPTLAHLLAMQGGILEPYPLELLAGGRTGRDARDPAAALALLLAQTTQNFVPGTRTLYSNGGIMLLQLAIERASGRTLAELLAAYVFAPVGMRDAVLAGGPASVRARTALAYTGDRIDDPLVVAEAPGGVVASLTDMIAFARWLRSDPHGRVAQISAAVHHADGSESGYALGFERQWVSGRLTIGHDGGHGGWAAQIRTVPALDMDIVLLANRADIGWGERVRELLCLACDLAPDPASTPRLFGRAAPPERWRATYVAESALDAVEIVGRDGEIEVGGRRLILAEGRARRTLGVEPVEWLSTDGWADAPPTLVRQEGNVAVRYARLDLCLTGGAGDPCGTYRHPDLPVTLIVGKHDGGWVLRFGPAWPASLPVALRHVAGGLWLSTSDHPLEEDLRLRFEPDGSLTVATGRIVGLRFERIGDAT